VAREVMMGPMDGVSLGPAGRAHPAVGPAADPAAIEQLAEWLVGAKAPLAIVGQPGRHREAVAELVKLAELLGIPIADTRGPVNFPSSHPLFLGGEAHRELSEADVILLLDVDVPWIPRQGGPSKGARIGQIDVDPLKTTVPLWGFPVDLPIQADTAKALPQLCAAIERLAGPERRAAFEQRRASVEAGRPARDRRLADEAEQARSRRPIAVE